MNTVNKQKEKHRVYPWNRHLTKRQRAASYSRMRCKQADRYGRRDARWAAGHHLRWYWESLPGAQGHIEANSVLFGRNWAIFDYAWCGCGCGRCHRA